VSDGGDEGNDGDCGVNAAWKIEWRLVMRLGEEAAVRMRVPRLFGTVWWSPARYLCTFGR